MKQQFYQTDEFRELWALGWKGKLMIAFALIVGFGAYGVVWVLKIAAYLVGIFVAFWFLVAIGHLLGII